MDMEEGPDAMLRLLDPRYASSRTVCRVAVQTQLFRMSFIGKRCPNLLVSVILLPRKLDRMGQDVAISGAHKVPLLLASIDLSCSLQSPDAALYTKDISELTWDYVATTLSDKYNAKLPVASSSSNKSPTSRRRNRARAHPRSKQELTSPSTGGSEHSSDIDPTARAFAIALKHVRSRGPTRNK